MELLKHTKKVIDELPRHINKTVAISIVQVRICHVAVCLNSNNNSRSGNTGLVGNIIPAFVKSYNNNISSCINHKLTEIYHMRIHNKCTIHHHTNSIIQTNNTVYRLLITIAFYIYTFCR